MTRRTPLLAALALALAGGVAHAEDPPQRTQDNIAVATTEADGSREFEFEWSLDRQTGGVVDHRNIANAAARCSDCRASAIAFQVVIARAVEGVAPRNQAVAINDQCVRCVVYAGARQFVRVVDRPVRFTAEGRAELADVRADLRALESKDLSVEELIAAVEAQEARVLRVLSEELIPREGSGRPQVRDTEDRQDDAG